MHKPVSSVSRALAVGLLAGLALLPAWAQQVVARVNGVAIVLDQLDRQHEEVMREKRLHPARMTDPNKFRALRQEALDRLVQVELLWQEARAQGLAVSDKDVETSVRMARKDARNEAGFDRLLMRLGMTEPQYREHVRKMLSGDRLAERIIEREVKVTDEDLQGFYDLNPRLFKQEEQVKPRLILLRVAPNASEADKAAQRDKLLALAERIRAGESMEALARQFSDDPTRQWGGEMDAFARGAGDRALEDAAFALKEGELSPPVWTAAGWNLLKLEQRTPAKVVALATAREQIRQHLMRTRSKDAIDKAVAGLREKAKIEVLASM
ncbi:parvulin-like peptidyl-prolyl isomerase [Burkholderiales bacterium JOSHI_001]|nr:parvulin-like peptidyl-prolyl isomerase [Burkholderiales bacterium JOSHI_001]